MAGENDLVGVPEIGVGLHGVDSATWRDIATAHHHNSPINVSLNSIMELFALITIHQQPVQPPCFDHPSIKSSGQRK